MKKKVWFKYALRYLGVGITILGWYIRAFVGPESFSVGILAPRFNSAMAAHQRLFSSAPPEPVVSKPQAFPIPLQSGWTRAVKDNERGFAELVEVAIALGVKRPSPNPDTVRIILLPDIRRSGIAAHLVTNATLVLEARGTRLESKLLARRPGEWDEVANQEELKTLTEEVAERMRRATKERFFDATVACIGNWVVGLGILVMTLSVTWDCWLDRRKAKPKKH